MTNSTKQQPTTDVLHRFIDRQGVVLKNTYHVIKRTPCGAWVYISPGNKRFILNTGTKRFATADLEEAKTSFLARKRRHLAILRAQINGIEHAVTAIQEGRINDYSHISFFAED